jgi:hypothetical protein
MAGQTMSAESLLAQRVSSPDHLMRFLWRCGHDTLAAPALLALEETARQFDESDWLALCAMANRERMGPLVFWHLASANLLTSLPPEAVSDLKRQYCVSLVRNRVLWSELQTILQAFAARGCDATPLKGVSLARRAYSEPALRPTGDTDLLISASAAETCHEALLSLGYAPQPGSERLTGRHAIRFQELIYTKAGKPAVELHTTLARAPSYRNSLPLAAVWNRAQEVSVDGQTLRRLHPHDEAMYLCLHMAAQHQFDCLIWLVDIAQILGAVPSAWDWDAFAREVIARRVATPVAVTLERAQAHLGVQAPAVIMRQLRAAARGGRERSAWRLAQAEFAHPRRAGLHFLGLPTVPQRLAFAREMTAVGLRRIALALRRDRL